MENRASNLLETLTSRGWCFRAVEEVKQLIQTHIATARDNVSVHSVESELLLNADLRSIGGKSLSVDSKKSSHLQGPKVLQIVSARDIYQSTIEASSGSSHGRRLLRIGLTDGHSEITAVEYSPIPSIPDDIIPGTKVRLENKAAIHSGILCLTSKVIVVLGGVVQSLHEEWQMSRRPRPTNKIDGDGPPPFEKLQVGGRSNRSAQPRISSEPTSKITFIKPGENVDFGDMGKSKDSNLEADKNKAANTTTSYGKMEQKPSSSDSRPKEVSEAVPVQNQAAAQKLLQKMNQPVRDGRHARGTNYRGRGKQEEQEVFTLEEWEKRKVEVKPPRGGVQDISHDAEIARQLQEQLDLEDFHENPVHESEAERIRASMFSFERVEEDRSRGRSSFRGRGKGRGRGRGRR